MPPSKSLSHKKKQILAADIILDNAGVVKKIFQAKKTRLSPPRTPIRIEDRLVLVDNSISTSISRNILTPIRQKQNDPFYKITGARLNISIQSYHPTKKPITNMIPYISKRINGNFNLKYKRQTSSNWRSLRNVNLEVAINQIIKLPSVSSQKKADDIVLSNYRRCYVEKYMTRTCSEQLLVMFPI